MIFAKMKQAVAHRLPSIHAHPFNLDLVEGSLPQEVFNRYVRQDTLYLRDFSQALFLVSQRLSKRAHAHAFLSYREQVVDFERKLHSQYLGAFSLRFYGIQSQSIQKIPVIEAYTRYLLETAKKDPVGVAVASLMPCFCIYNDLGKIMQRSPGYNISNPYFSWIQSYSGKRFTAATQSLVCIADDIGNTVEPIQEQMIQAFALSTEYEISFWDSVYHKPEKNHDTDPEHQLRLG